MSVTEAQIQVARTHGIIIPTIAARASEKADVPYYVTCAFLMQESDGGQNVFGHDPTIFAGAGPVTKLKYLAYRRQRAESGMQGVGPMQLTWWEFQDRADTLGGCWKPDINVLVGLQIVRAHHVATGSWVEAARRYNGSGAAADAYAAQMAERFATWQEVLAMPKPEDPYEVIRLGTDTSGRSILLNRRMAAAVDAVHSRLGGTTLTIVQGAYMARAGGGAVDSAGYHDEGGCLDWRVWDLASKGLQLDQVIRALRSVGWAAWHRDQAHGGMDEHIHGVLLDDRDAASGARWQMGEYRAGRDGLASAGRDYHWRPRPIPTFDYQAWTSQAGEDDMQLDEIINPGADKKDQLSVGEALRIAAKGSARIETMLKDQARQLPAQLAAVVEADLPDGLTKEQKQQIRDIVYTQSQRATSALLGQLDEPKKKA